MNSLTKYRVVTLGLAGLLLVTLSALGSILCRTWMKTKPIEKMEACTSSCQMLTMELELDPAQNAGLEAILDRYSDTSAVLLNALRENRMALLEELRKEPPDSLRIRILTGEIGLNQTLLTRLAASQYLQIRGICSPEQQEKLCNVYCDLFGCPRQGMDVPRGKEKEQEQGQGKQHRYRHGNQKN